MGSVLFYTGRVDTGDQLYSAIGTTEMLYKKKLTFCRIINKNRKVLHAEIKTVKERKNEPSEFFWKKDTPVMLASYVPNPGKNMLLISTWHEGSRYMPLS